MHKIAVVTLTGTLVGIGTSAAVFGRLQSEYAISVFDECSLRACQRMYRDVADSCPPGSYERTLCSAAHSDIEERIESIEIWRNKEWYKRLFILRDSIDNTVIQTIREVTIMSNINQNGSNKKT